MQTNRPSSPCTPVAESAGAGNPAPQTLAGGEPINHWHLPQHQPRTMLVLEGSLEASFSLSPWTLARHCSFAPFWVSGACLHKEAVLRAHTLL